MSVTALPPGAPTFTADEVKALASKAHLTLNEEHVSDFQRLLGAMDQTIKEVLEYDDYMPMPDVDKYPRTDIHIPSLEDSDKGGWATKVTAKATSPTSDILKGKTVALKDNIALAGVRCTNGTAAIDWTPEIDATIATRIMDAGGIITGKSACENTCLEGVSDTACTGKVHNPYADNYSAGGSSSGSGRLVATGSVDMAMGGDQGGSVRIPASMCGIVGHKPTWGLVPYTGIISGEATIDHTGPMTKSVRDCALLLDAIAGTDGIDDRQPPFLPSTMMDYTRHLDDFASSALDPAKPLTGVKVGILKEGFTIPNMDANVAKACSSAVDKLTDLGATVSHVSVPSHSTAVAVWACSLPIAGGRQGSLSDMTGRKQLFMTDRIAKTGKELSQDAWEASGPGAQNQYLRYLMVEEKYGAPLHAKVTNLLRKDDYDRALKDVDVLVMPTIPCPPCKLLDDPATHGPLERLTRTVGLVGNTAPFNSTGHPALTIPVGFVPAKEDETVKLPTGLQFVGKKWHDADCLKVGAAWEKAYDWKTV